MQPNQLLSPAGCWVLLSLCEQPRHGYDILHNLEAESQGRLLLSISAIYGTIKGLVEEGLLEYVPYHGSERRRYYRLTKRGWDQLRSNLEYYRLLNELGKQHHVL